MLANKMPRADQGGANALLGALNKHQAVSNAFDHDDDCESVCGERAYSGFDLARRRQLWQRPSWSSDLAVGAHLLIHFVVTLWSSRVGRWVGGPRITITFLLRTKRSLHIVMSSDVIRVRGWVGSGPDYICDRKCNQQAATNAQQTQPTQQTTDNGQWTTDTRQETRVNR